MNIFQELSDIWNNFLDFFCPKRRQRDPDKTTQVIFIVMQYFSGSLGIELKRLVAILVTIEYMHRMQFGVPFMDIDWSKNVYNNVDIINRIYERKELRFRNYNDEDLVVVHEDIYNFNKTIHKDQQVLVRTITTDCLYKKASKVVYKSLTYMNHLIKDSN